MCELGWGQYKYVCQTINLVYIIKIIFKKTMLQHIKNNKNIYITIGVLAVAGAISYLSISEVFDFKKRTKKDSDD